MAELVDLDALREAAAELGVAVSAEQAQALTGYVRLLERWNGKFNLVSRRDVGRIVSRHVLDSLSISRWLRGVRVLDVGTGAGLPGIPLAIVNAERQFVLVDRAARKTRFLEQVVMTLGLINVTVQCRDAGDLNRDCRFSTVVTRAVGSLSKLWRITEPLLEPGGRLVVMNRTGLPTDSDHECGVGLLDLPVGLGVVRERVRVPGLAGEHEVLLVEMTS